MKNCAKAVTIASGSCRAPWLPRTIAWDSTLVALCAGVVDPVYGLSKLSVVRVASARSFLIIESDHLSFESASFQVPASEVVLSDIVLVGLVKVPSRVNTS